MAPPSLYFALFSLQLLLILGIKIEGLGAAEDVCEGKNVQHLATFLEEEDVRTVSLNFLQFSCMNITHRVWKKPGRHAFAFLVQVFP